MIKTYSVWALQAESLHHSSPLSSHRWFDKTWAGRILEQLWENRWWFVWLSRRQRHCFWICGLNEETAYKQRKKPRRKKNTHEAWAEVWHLSIPTTRKLRSTALPVSVWQWHEGYPSYTGHQPMWGQAVTRSLISMTRYKSKLEATYNDERSPAERQESPEKVYFEKFSWNTPSQYDCIVHANHSLCNTSVHRS